MGLFDFEEIDFGEVKEVTEERNRPIRGEKKVNKRRTTACIELTEKYLYRRAFSEVSLLDAMRHEELKRGHSYNFLTGGNVDSLSYLKIVLNKHPLDYCLLTTWCMGGGRYIANARVV